MSENMDNIPVGTVLKNKKCFACGGLIVIKNPTGHCDHLYYPQNVNWRLAL